MSLTLERTKQFLAVLQSTAEQEKRKITGITPVKQDWTQAVILPASSPGFQMASMPIFSNSFFISNAARKFSPAT